MLKQLAVDCLKPKPNLNNLSQLLSVMMNSVGSEDKLTCTKYLMKIFMHYHSINLFSKSKQETVQYLVNKLNCFGQLLSTYFFNQEDNRDIYMSALEQILKIEHELKRQTILNRFVGMLLEVDQSYWSYMNKAQLVSKIMKKITKTEHKVVLLVSLPPDLTYRQWMDQQHNKKRLKQAPVDDDDPDIIAEFQKSYENLLISTLKDKNLPQQSLNKLMSHLGDAIYRNLSSPLLLSQFILDRFKTSEDLEVRVHALAGLYILIGKYGLELQNFYDHLYNLITLKIDNESVFSSKKCRRIYKLIENALRSSKVPQIMVEKFVKTLSNEIFEQGTQFALWMTALLFNIFKKHRNLLTSSLKSEIEVLKNHFMPQIRTIVQELTKKDLSKLDFLDIDSFATIRISKLLQQKMDEIEGADFELELPDRLNPLAL